MSDNAWVYTRSRAVRQLLARSQIRHLTTEPYRPHTHRERAAALPHWLHHHNTMRSHSSLGGQPPISRVHNLRGQDI
jgi:transposase InsO family protein